MYNPPKVLTCQGVDWHKKAYWDNLLHNFVNEVLEHNILICSEI